jgi:outer membrane protein assembly factor BamB
VTRGLSRRAALLLPLAAAGCDEFFGTEKAPLPGTRIPVMAPGRGLAIDNPPGRPVVLPPPAPNDAWPQAGGTAGHVMENPAAATVLHIAWSAEIGEGGGYREAITARPVIANRRVFTMDSDAVVCAFGTINGTRLWRTPTRAKKNRSTNVGGGLGLDGDTLYVTTGRGDALALDPASGKIRWRVDLGNPARTAPTIAEGRLFVALIDGTLQALSTDNGTVLWSYQGGTPDTGVLGLPAPAYSEGILVAGFGSGDLVALHATSGGVAWSDNLASSAGRNSMVDLPAIRAMPVIDRAEVFAVGLGGLMLCLDLRSGRRLWEREIAASNTPWLAGDWLFVISTDQKMAALNRADGAVAWVRQLPHYENEKKQTGPISWLGPVLVSDRLVAVGSVPSAVAISPYTGLPLGIQRLPGAGALDPVVADGTLFIVLDDATLLALR